MAGNMKQVVLFLAAIAAVIGISSAATFTVGDSTGWTIPSSPSLYSTWASKQKIKVGDTLVFTFPAGIHTVAEVSKSAYDSCSAASPLSAVLTTAPANITVSSAGTHYFICTITGHCSAGQKLAVVATGSSPAKAPKTAKAASPAPSPAATVSATAPTTATAAAPTTVSAAGPSGIPTTTTAAGGAPASLAPGTAAPPSGNFAATNAAGLGFVGLISAAVVALLV